ncbi:MAG: Nif3-like dinuclear metal center hexameric protein [Cyanobacteria bacterium RUI128]|nr:Nif3-like dinuclear metal center hexameric protein [Cyanobacteria bacterium RUI128]
MNKFDLVHKIEKFAPLDTQEKWDCSGWLVCTKKNDINKVMLALTVTDDVVSQAKKNGCDMIISHHPLFCVPLGYSDVDIYCAHTNMDKAQGGTTDTLIKTLGLSSCETVEEFVRIVKLDKPVGVKEFFDKLKQVSPNARYINNKNVTEIQKIGFCAGSGSEFIFDSEVDAFVTGDLKFHTALDSKIVVYDIGHFESEILILPVFKDILGIDVVYAKEKSPFIY